MNDDLSRLTAISPIDGRYFDVTYQLQNYFSEYAYLKTGIEVEIKYLIFLSDQKIIRTFSKKERKILEDAYGGFSPKKALELKNNGAKDGLRIHDIKSVEYYIRNTIRKTSLNNISGWIHFGLTSNDIIDNAYRILVKDSLDGVLIPKIGNLVSSLDKLARKHIALPILGRTHGQPAVPTTFGKEIAVFSARIKKEAASLKTLELYGKFGGAVGNWNALTLAFPEKKWPSLSTKFLKTLGLRHFMPTTQIAPSEDLISLFQTIYRINSVIIGFNQDMWRYISDDWIAQKEKNRFVGSSTMPQKVNPIEFENSEGNLVMANGVFETLCRKLPISRLQRDLSGSTVLRNIGVAFAHSLVAYESCQKGIDSIEPNKEKILADLNEDWSILSEALQTILRKEGKPDAYESVASQIRGKKLTKEGWIKLIGSINISKKEKDKLLNLTPETYTGIF